MIQITDPGSKLEITNEPYYPIFTNNFSLDF